MYILQPGSFHENFVNKVLLFVFVSVANIQKFFEIVQPFGALNVFFFQTVFVSFPDTKIRNIFLTSLFLGAYSSLSLKLSATIPINSVGDIASFPDNQPFNA